MQPLVRKTLSCWLFVGTIIIRPTLIEAGASFGSGLYVWPTHRGHIMPIPTPFRILRPAVWIVWYPYLAPSIDNYLHRLSRSKVSRMREIRVQGKRQVHLKEKVINSLNQQCIHSRNNHRVF